MHYASLCYALPTFSAAASLPSSGSFHVSIAGSRGMSDVQFRKTATTGPWMVVWTQELNQQSATSMFYQ